MPTSYELEVRGNPTTVKDGARGLVHVSSVQLHSHICMKHEMQHSAYEHMPLPCYSYVVYAVSHQRYPLTN